MSFTREPIIPTDSSISITNPVMETATQPATITPSIIAASHKKFCHADIAALRPTESELQWMLSNQLFDSDATSCVPCFDSGNPFLQISFAVPGLGAPIEVRLLGNSLLCQEPFTLVYIDLDATSETTKKQCTPEESTRLNGMREAVECSFVCFTTPVAGNTNLTMVFEAARWKIAKHVHARLCEVTVSLLNM